MRKLFSIDPDATLFSSLVTSEEVGVEKPGEQGFALALRKMGLSAKGVLMVGDHFEKDVVGASKLGFRTWWIAESNASVKTTVPEGLVGTGITGTGPDSWIEGRPENLMNRKENALILSSFAAELGEILLIQGPGGNVAPVKSEDQKRLSIKASGFRLDQVTSEQGIAEVDRERFLSRPEIRLARPKRKIESFNTQEVIGQFNDRLECPSDPRWSWDSMH